MMSSLSFQSEDGGASPEENIPTKQEARQETLPVSLLTSRDTLELAW